MQLFSGAVENQRSDIQAFEYVDVWRVPLVPTSGDGAPTQIVDACSAVGSDLHCRRHGPDVYLENAVWTISLLETGDCHIGLEPGPRPRHKTAGVEPLKSFSFGGLHIDQSLAEATVLIADTVQGELAGYPPFIQWPIEEKRLLMPLVRDGRAIWRDPRTDRQVAEIGLLRSA
ncbi:hypothetical protein [Rhodococcus sp. IEGM 1379]|uniref:hypothetical protein n=1 Tax=Rhodococcus sp. IEGM 1379 TaxID=3047086 RepID=UPI0024B84989|nr:hypothetical protein [Rhodococcus sp. IEGM 1379]MDI9917748.1 hypothetical protein [Rhodococcus sp. IEGM 1379]